MSSRHPNRLNGQVTLLRHLLAKMMRGFGHFERLLLLVGLLLVSVYISNQVYRSLYSHTAVQKFWAGQAPAQRQVEPRSLPADVVPDFRLWSEKRIKAYEASLLAQVPPPLGVLQISALKLQVPVLEGTDDLTLDRAVGHIAGTALPGETGNIGIAGHRDGFFRGLKDLPVGQTIDLYGQHGKARYVIDGIEIVSPTDVFVLEPRAKPSVTLVTCYPFYYVGSAPQRYIVHATLVDASELKRSEHSGLEAKSRVGTIAN